MIFQPNRNIFIQWNAFENVCKYRPFCSGFIGVNVYFHAGCDITPTANVPTSDSFENIVLLSPRWCMFSYKACKYHGQFLPHQYDQCSYYRCDFGDEPWYDEYGNIKFVAVPMKCAHGTSTNRYEFDLHNPCGETSNDCGHKGNGMMTSWYGNTDCPLESGIRRSAVVSPDMG